MPMNMPEEELKDYLNGEGTRMKSDKNPGQSILKSFPTSICVIARREFPNAKNNTDAVVAYMYVHCPELIESQRVKNELSPSQWDLIRDRKASSEGSVNDRLLALMKKSDSLSKDIDRIRLVVDYILYHRLSFEEINIGDLSQLNVNSILDRHDRFLSFERQMDDVHVQYKDIKDERDGRHFT